MATLRSLSSKPGKTRAQLEIAGRLQPDPQAGRKHRLGADSGARPQARPRPQRGNDQQAAEHGYGGFPDEMRSVRCLAGLTWCGNGQINHRMSAWRPGRARDFVTGWLAGPRGPSYMSH